MVGEREHSSSSASDGQECHTGGYRSVIRHRGTLADRFCEKDREGGESVSGGQVGHPAGIRPPVPEAKGLKERSGGESVTSLPPESTDNFQITAWWQLLKRPWSWKWKRFLLLGGALSLILGALAKTGETFSGFYAIVLSLLIPSTLVLFFHEIDIRSRISWAWLALIMAIGGGIAGLVAGIVNVVYGVSEEAAAWAGVTEEPIKGAVILALAFFPKRFPGVLAGLSLGVAIGAGFAVYETIDYAYTFGSGEMPSTMVLFVRGALSPFMHLGWTGALGGAMWLARGDRSGWYALGSLSTWGVFAGVIILHAIWNSIGDIGYLSVGLWVLLFYYAKRGVAEAVALGYRPRGVKE